MNASNVLNVGVLVSGYGSNLQALIDHQNQYKIRLVISNKAEALALQRAKDANIPDYFLAYPNFENPAIALLKSYQVDLIVLAGFMRILSSDFVQTFPNRIINIHPSLLPAFPGKNAIGQAFKAGCKQTGCSIHLVDSGIDTGKVLEQAIVDIDDQDDERSLGSKIQDAEHILLIKVVNDIANGKHGA